MAAKGYSKRDKITALAVLQKNGGNVKRTAHEMGVNRKTLTNWLKQLESDVGLLKDVEAVRSYLADLEELTAMKAQAELSRRLDKSPKEIKDSDLLRIKDSAINNSRLLRDQSTANIAVVTPRDKARKYFEFLIANGIDRADAIRQVRGANALDIDGEVLNEVANEIAAETML